MGLFSGETQMKLSSTIYNLAGDAKDRPEFMRSIILRSVLSNSRASMASEITSSLIGGTGMSLRRYYRWAQNNYYLDFEGEVARTDTLDQTLLYQGLGALIPTGPNQHLEILTAKIDTADVGFFIDDYVFRMRPDLQLNPDGTPTWYADFDPATNEMILKVDGQPDVRLPAPADLIWVRGARGRQLVYATYRHRTLYFGARWGWGPVFIYTYRMSSGSNTNLENLGSVKVEMNEFYPAIPIRVWNSFVTDIYPADKVSDIEDAYRKLTGSRVSTLIAQLEDNPSLGDIDHAYVVPGVDLGSKDKAAQDYLFKFFEHMAQASNLTKTDLVEQQRLAHLLHNQDWTVNSSQFFGNTSGENKNWDGLTQSYTHPTYGQNPATQPTIPVTPSVEELVISHGDWTNFMFKIQWHYIKETDHVGNMMRYDGVQRPLGKTGTHWITTGWPIGLDYQFVTANGVLRWQQRLKERIYMFHQYAPRRYKKLEIVGLEHRNAAYATASVYTSAGMALANPNPDQASGFLIPLHYPTFKKMGLVKGTELSRSVSHLVLNSYEEVTIPWYASGFFKVFVMIASVALSAFTAGGSIAAGAGLLGTNLAVGTALGVSAASAALIGAVVNYVAAIVVTQLISWGAKEMFGDEWGAIIGAIASFVAINIGTNFMSGGDFQFQFNDLLKPENLLSMTNAASKAYTNFINTETEEIYDEMAGLETEYDKKMKQIEELSDEILGMTNGLIDPMMFTDASNEYLGESSKAFLSRTLLVGSDIADLSYIMIEDFADISLELPKGVTY